MADQIDVGVLTQLDGAHLAEYFDSLAKTPEVRRVAVSDSDGKCEAAARAALGAKFAGFYTDHKAMLAAVDPALALVTREPVASPPVIADALAAGCHVLTEKPACVAPEDFAPLVTMARAKHLQLMLALGNRPLAPVQEARRLIRRGLLGKIYGLSMFLVADQARLKRHDYRKQWRGYKARAGGGHLAWLGIHWLDLATYVTGLHVEEVAGFTEVVGGQPIDVEDSASVALRYTGGVLGTMLSGFYLDLKHKENVGKYHSHMQIWGEHGWLRLAVFEEEPMTWYSSLEPGPPQVQTFRYPKGDRSYLPLVRAAVRAAAGADEPPITGEEGLEVLRTIYGLYRAAETKRSQNIVEENR